jgi:hypothetical protein
VARWGITPRKTVKGQVDASRARVHAPRAVTTTVIPSRFCGPPNIGHGGYVAALLAEPGSATTQVTLRKPAPLETPLEIRELEGGKRGLFYTPPTASRLGQGDVLIAEGERVAPLDMHIPAPPTLIEARASEAGSPAHFGEAGVHPRCFGCGKLRPPGDGLRLFAGPAPAWADRREVASIWQPAPFDDGTGFVERLFVIAALDCPGAFAFMAEHKNAGLLGRIAYEVYAPVRSTEEHVVTGWQIGHEGRKMFAGTALFDQNGTLLAAARATWIAFT